MDKNNPKVEQVLPGDMERAVFDSADQTEQTNSQESTVVNSEQVSQRQSTMAEVKTYPIQKFNGENFQLWKMQMEIFMAENELEGYILGTTVRTEQNRLTWDKKNIQARAFLMRGFELEQLKYLTNCQTAAQMWSRLLTVHAEKSDQSAQVLLDRFINAKMGDDEKMTDYVARMTSIAARLKDLDLEQKEPMIIAKILDSLPEKYDHVRTAWYAVAKADRSVEKLSDHLVNEETLITMRQGIDKYARRGFSRRFVWKNE